MFLQLQISSPGRGPTQDFNILMQKVYNGRMVALGCGAPVAALASAGQPGGLHWHVLSSGVLLKIARSTASWSKFFVKREIQINK